MTVMLFNNLKLILGVYFEKKINSILNYFEKIQINFQGINDIFLTYMSLFKIPRHHVG